MTGRRNRYLYTVGAPSRESIGWRMRQVTKRDHEAGISDSFDYGPGVIAEEHVFVPRHVPRSEDDGWLVGPYLDYVQGSSGIAVFDARSVADGPVARARLDYPLPLALHGHFSRPEADPRRARRGHDTPFEDRGARGAGGREHPRETARAWVRPFPRHAPEPRYTR